MARCATRCGTALALVAAAAGPALAWDVDAIGSGTGHKLAVDSDGLAWSFGDNQHGQLGNGDGSGLDQLRPVAVLTTDPSALFKAVDGGTSHSLALGRNGRVWAWGRNHLGQAGLGNTATPVTTPALVSIGTNSRPILAVAAGGDHTLALRDDGVVFGWGRNDHGQLGLGTVSAFESTPRQIPTLSNVVAIAAGVDFSLALTAGGQVYAFGADDRGQLGNGTGTGDRPTPALVSGVASGVAIAAGDKHAIAIKKVVSSKGTAWTLYAWGANSEGQLGINSLIDRTTAVAVSVPAGSPVTSIAAGRAHTIGLRADGRMVAAGSNTRGQLGAGLPFSTVSKVLVLVPSLALVKEIAAGGDGSMARQASTANPLIERSIWAWGANDEGQIGENSTRDWNVVRRIWFFSVGTGTGCRDVKRYSIGYPDNSAHTKVLTALTGLGTEIASASTAVPSRPQRGFLLFELNNPAMAPTMTSAALGAGAHFVEQDCRIYASASGPEGSAEESAALASEALAEDLLEPGEDAIDIDESPVPSAARPTPTPACVEVNLFPRDFGYRKENNIDCTVRNDPRERFQHNLQNTGWEAAWARFMNRTLTSRIRSVKAAILDTGILGSHPDFLPATLDDAASLDLIADPAGRVGFPGGLTDANPRRHGTGVASLMVARTDDTLASQRGIASTTCPGPTACSREALGVYTHPVKLVLMRVLDASEIGTGATVAFGIIRARNYGAEVINMSLGSLADSAPVREACDAARNGTPPGIVLVAAAGNHEQDWVMFPAAYETVLGVGSSQETALNLRSTWSNYGNGIDVWASGENVLGSMGEDSGSETRTRYAYRAGTSYAAPLVSGSAILALAANELRLRPCDIEDRIRTCGTPVDSHGNRLDAKCVLETPLNAGDCPYVSPEAPADVVPPASILGDYSGGIGFVGTAIPSGVR